MTNNQANEPQRKTIFNQKNLLLGIVVSFGVIAFLPSPDRQVNQLSNPIPKLYLLESKKNYQRPLPTRRNCCTLKKTTNYKTILLYTPFYIKKDWMFGGFGQDPFVKYECPVSNCYVTNDVSKIGAVEKFDAVLFHKQDMQNGRVLLPNQEIRQRNQIYILFSLESPQYDNFPHRQFNGKTATT